MTDCPVVPFSPLIFECDNFFVLDLFEDFTGYRCSADQGRPWSDVRSFRVQEASAKVTLSPAEASNFSTLIVSPGLTRYCLPPERIIAYAMARNVWKGRETATVSLL